jgi:hypothetical protein
MNTLFVHSREELAAAIESLPLDSDCEIVLIRKDGRTRYTFPAVCCDDGRERRPHSKPRGPEQHAAWQRKRRGDMAKRVRRMARRYFE